MRTALLLAAVAALLRGASAYGDSGDPCDYHSSDGRRCYTLVDTGGRQTKHGAAVRLCAGGNGTLPVVDSEQAGRRMDKIMAEEGARFIWIDGGTRTGRPSKDKRDWVFADGTPIPDGLWSAATGEPNDRLHPELCAMWRRGRGIEDWPCDSYSWFVLCQRADGHNGGGTTGPSLSSSGTRGPHRSSTPDDGRTTTATDRWPGGTGATGEAGTPPQHTDKCFGRPWGKCRADDERQCGRRCDSVPPPDGTEPSGFTCASSRCCCQFRRVDGSSGNGSSALSSDRTPPARTSTSERPWWWTASTRGWRTTGSGDRRSTGATGGWHWRSTTARPFDHSSERTARPPWRQSGTTAYSDSTGGWHWRSTTAGPYDRTSERSSRPPRWHTTRGRHEATSGSTEHSWRTDTTGDDRERTTAAGRSTSPRWPPYPVAAGGNGSSSTGNTAWPTDYSSGRSPPPAVCTRRHCLHVVAVPPQSKGPADAALACHSRFGGNATLADPRVAASEVQSLAAALEAHGAGSWAWLDGVAQWRLGHFHLADGRHVHGHLWTSGDSSHASQPQPSAVCGRECAVLTAAGLWHTHCGNDTVRLAVCMARRQRRRTPCSLRSSDGRCGDQ